MANHGATGDEQHIASEVLNLLWANHETNRITPIDHLPFQGLDVAYLRVIGEDGETYYIQVSKRKIHQ